MKILGYAFFAEGVLYITNVLAIIIWSITIALLELILFNVQVFIIILVGKKKH